MRFVDTNVLLYAVSDDPAEAPKTAAARDVLDSTDLALSVQVLQEFYVQATRRTRDHPLPHTTAVTLIESWLRFPVQRLDVDVLRAALATKERYQLSYWDAAIVEAARACGCHTVLTEDLHHGLDCAGVRVENPFPDTA